MAPRIEHAPLTLSTGQKLMGLVLAVVMGTVSVAGTYLVFKAVTETRLNDVEKRVERLEIKTDEQQRTISDIKGKLDVLVAITERIERKLDKQP